MRALLFLCATALAASAAHHDLKATPETVAYGNYNAQAKPVLTIASGDTVTIQTVSHALTPEDLGVPKEEIPANLAIIRNGAHNGGPGRHWLTGPIFVSGAEPGDVLEVRWRPFWGGRAAAPPAGRIDSGPPWIHGGNLDNKELVAGTTLYIPVHVKGALFQTGDGHAGQGDGEVDITAMETSLTGTFRFVVRKDLHLNWPRAETPTHFIVMGMNEELVD